MDREDFWWMFELEPPREEGETDDRRGPEMA